MNFKIGYNCKGRLRVEILADFLLYIVHGLVRHAYKLTLNEIHWSAEF